MAQSSLCIDITLTGPALLQNASNSKCSYFSHLKTAAKAQVSLCIDINVPKSRFPPTL